MKIAHHIKEENSGLMRAALELCHWEERLGHEVSIYTPTENKLIHGEPGTPDIHVIHSQLHPNWWYSDTPKVMLLHGEPLSSVANGVSMKAIVDLAPMVDAFICMREEEQSIWSSIKRTYVVPKGVDLERYKPQEPKEKLSGAPAVLYCENWRGNRNPLYLCAAMRIVWQQIPDARLHLWNCQDPKLYKTFRALFDHAKWGLFLRTINGPAGDVVDLYNSADIVVSCLHPLYARTAVESLACGKPHIGPGYGPEGYPYKCELSPESMAEAILKAWSERESFNAREWAESHHSGEEMARQCVGIYERYL